MLKVGASLDAVLYVTNKEHALALLDGVSTEVGRIGYVAATRARDLLWVAVPHSALKELRPMLLARGFKEVGVAPARQPAARSRSSGHVANHKKLHTTNALE
jgi:hypothetical protein